MNCYKVKVKTTDSVLNDSFQIKKSENGGIGEYFDCENSIIYIITDTANRIYEKFGDDVIISIEKIGIGYIV